MKNKKYICLISLMIIILFVACTNNNKPAISNKIEYPVNVDNVTKNSNTNVTIKKLNITSEDLKKYLKMPKSKILRLIGKDYETSSTTMVESHMSFPSIYSKTLGVYFVFPNDIDDYPPTYIIVDQENNTNDINLKGAKPGMSFKEIAKYLGKKSVTKTWITTEEMTTYKVEYMYKGLIYRFVCDLEDEKNTELNIYLQINN